MPTPMRVGEIVEAAEARKFEHFILDQDHTRRDSMSEYRSRLLKLDAFLDGSWTVQMPNGREIADRPKIENRVLTKVEDTGYLAASTLPTIGVHPVDERDFKNAEMREKVYQFYWQNSEIDLWLPHIFMDQILIGLSAVKVWPDFNRPIEQRYPMLSRLDPRHILPPLDFIVNNTIEPHDIIEVKQRKLRDIFRDYPTQAAKLKGMKSDLADTDSIEVLNYWGRDAIVRVARPMGSQASVILDAFYNETDCCPVILGARPTADGKLRGKVEAMIPVITAENRLWTYLIDYADQMVYSPIAYQGDVANPGDFGPMAQIDLGSQGSIQRVAPAQSNPEVFQIIAGLERQSRRAGNLPEARAGDVSQSIGSAAFVESLMGGLTTEVQRYQRVVESMLRRANSVAAEQDKIYCDARKPILLSKGGSKRTTYTPSELLKDTTNFVSYGAGSGLDKFNAEIRMIQRERSGYVSKRWVRENLDGIERVGEEEERLLDEAALTAVLQGILARASAGDLSPLGEFMRIREEKGSVLEAVQSIAALAAGPVQPAGRGTPGPQAQQPPAAAEALALAQGGIPGGAQELQGGPPAAPEVNLPPLAAVGL